MAAFYQIQQGENLIEYSTNFAFFLEHQVATTKSNTNGLLEGFSRLNGMEFFAIDRDADEKRVLDNFRIVHEWIMQGKYGKGQLVD